MRSARRLRCPTAPARAVALAGAALALPCAAPRLGAQDPQSYSIPSAPALQFLNASATSTTQGSLRSLAVALADGVDSTGRAQAGLAVDFIPWHLLRWPRISLPAYRRPAPAYQVANLQLSLGTVRGSGGDSASTNLAFGVRSMVFDRSDALTHRDYAAARSASLRRCAVAPFVRDLGTLTPAPNPLRDSLRLRTQQGSAAFGDVPAIRQLRVLQANADDVLAHLAPLVREAADAQAPLRASLKKTVDSLSLRWGATARDLAATLRALAATDVPAGGSASTRAALPQHLRTVARDVTELSAALERLAPLETNALADSAGSCAERDRTRALAEWRRTHWNAASFALSAALGVRLDSSRFSARRWMGYSVWGGGRLPLTPVGLLLYQLRYDNRVADGQTSSADAGRHGAILTAGLRAARGSEAHNVFAEFSEARKVSGAVEARSKASAGAEFRVAQDVWLSAGMGQSFAKKTEKARTFLLANLRWGLATGALLK